ncbi:MAG TPA: hypothetical protein DD990_02335 [Cyanobacteria bacterium UBA11368]|nr:hypothetical protein [Cyanobacteria bacterium UBA11368]
MILFSLLTVTINRLSYAIAITAICLLALTGCNSTTQPTTQASPGIETTAPKTKNKGDASISPLSTHDF